MSKEVVDHRLKTVEMVEKLHKTIYNQDQKIAYLEAKLEEMTEKYNACQEARKLEIEFNKQDKAELKQQLAEWQDGTIICKWTDAENKVKDLEHQLAEKEELIMFADRTIKGLVLAKEIDKISFCVEQLEKVKEKINDCPITDYDTNKHFVKMYQSDAIRQLDNQIKAIKGDEVV